MADLRKLRERVAKARTSPSGSAASVCACALRGRRVGVQESRAKSITAPLFSPPCSRAVCACVCVCVTPGCDACVRVYVCVCVCV